MLQHKNDKKILYYSNSDPRENRTYYKKREARRRKNILIFIFLLICTSITSYILWYNYIFPDKYTLTGIIAPITILILMIVIQLYKRYRMAGATIKQIDKMDGIEFEKYLQIYYRRLGYKTTITPPSGDFGADLIIENKEGIKYAVQAKRYRSHVGVEAVQQAISSKEYYGANKAAVITNSFYTDPAKEMAKKTGTILIDRYGLGTKKMNL